MTMSSIMPPGPEFPRIPDRFARRQVVHHYMNRNMSGFAGQENVSHGEASFPVAANKLE
jgi:hypothetical protein